MQAVKTGDVVLYAVRIREKGRQALYYGCEVVRSIEGGQPRDASGAPITGVKMVYHRNVISATAPSEGRRLLARAENDPDEKSRLADELGKIYGPGELVTGFICPGHAFCGMH